MTKTKEDWGTLIERAESEEQFWASVYESLGDGDDRWGRTMAGGRGVLQSIEAALNFYDQSHWKKPLNENLAAAWQREVEQMNLLKCPPEGVRQWLSIAQDVAEDWWLDSEGLLREDEIENPRDPATNQYADEAAMEFAHDVDKALVDLIKGAGWTAEQLEKETG